MPLATFLLSLIPMGPPLIWVPATAWLAWKGNIDKVVKLSGAKAADIPLLLQGNVYPLAADQVVLLGAPTTKALADTAAFLKEQKKVDAVLPDYAPSVNATFVTQ